MVRDDAKKLGLHLWRCSNYGTAGPQIVMSRELRRPPARFGDDEKARETVPGVDVRLVIADQSAAGDVSQHQRSRSTADEDATGVQKVMHESGDRGAWNAVIDAKAHKPLIEGPAAADADLRPVKRRSAPALG